MRPSCKIFRAIQGVLYPASIARASASGKRLQTESYTASQATLSWMFPGVTSTCLLYTSHPIVVWKQPDGALMILSGHNRVRAYTALLEKTGGDAAVFVLAGLFQQGLSLIHIWFSRPDGFL